MPLRITISKENYLKAIAEAESEGETVKAVTLARWLQRFRARGHDGDQAPAARRADPRRRRRADHADARRAARSPTACSIAIT